jgi:hypothetical protein
VTDEHHPSIYCTQLNVMLNLVGLSSLTIETLSSIDKLLNSNRDAVITVSFFLEKSINNET